MAKGKKAEIGRTQRGLLIGIIGDVDTVTGFLLTGIGQRSKAGNSWFVVQKDSTRVESIEEAFSNMIQRSDIGMIMINQFIANDIRHLINRHSSPIPTILEIPSKDHPYDVNKDKVMVRVKQLLGKD